MLGTLKKDVVGLIFNTIGVKYFFWLDFVFDGQKRIPYLETDAPNPLSVYGASKLQGERSIQETTEAYFIVRTSWLYSEYGKNFMKTMLSLSETLNEISVVSDQIGSPTYAGDLAEVLIQIVLSSSTNYGVYHYKMAKQSEFLWACKRMESFKAM